MLLDIFPTAKKGLMDTGHTTKLGRCLEQIEAGSEDAREAAIEHTCDRLRIIASRMLRGSPKVKRWTDTDDLLQDALIRLHRSLAEVKPATARQFYGLAATQLRRQLIDLARKQYGVHGIGANHQTDSNKLFDEQPSNQPQTLDAWTEFHQQIDLLPEDEKEVVHLLFYDGLTQSEAAKVLGISLATLKRRWQAARLTLTEQMEDQPR